MLSAGDADLARRDPALPGLAVLLDPDLLLEAACLFLAETPESARSTYLRYKPGTSCLVGYRLRTGGVETDFHARAYRREAVDKLRAPPEQPSAEPGPRTVLLQDLGIVLSFFPNDRRLKSLARLDDARSRRQIVSRFLPERPDAWDGTLHCLRYKPERRYVAAISASGEPVAVVRLYSAPGFRAACAGSKRLRCGDTLRLARRLARSNRHRMVVFEWVPGQVFGDAVVRPDFDPAEAVRVGVALAELHAQRNARVKLLSREEEAATLREVAAGLASLRPDLSRLADPLARQLAQRIVEFPPMDCTIHGDFHAHQVVLDGDRVGIIDMDATVRGNPAADLGNFLAHLHFNALRGELPPDRVETLAQSVCQGYRMTGTDFLPEQIGVYTAAGLLRVAPHFFRNRDPDWPERIEAILDRAATMLRTDAPSRYGEVASRFAAKRGPEPDVHVSDPFEVAKDPQMPFLAGALDPREAFDRLAPVARRLMPVDLRTAMRAVRVTRHKPGRRCLVEYDFELADGDGPRRAVTLVGKARAKGLDESTYRLQEQVWKAGFDSHGEGSVGVPRPLACIRPWQMWFQQKCPGVAATKLLAGPDGVALARRIAEAIAQFHRLSIPLKRSHTMADELGILHQRLPKVAEANPALSGRIGRILEACDRLGAAVAPPRPATIHRDFYPDHVLVDGPRLYLLDLDLCCEGDPALDVGNFCGHLQEQALRLLGRADSLSDVQSAFEDRYLELAGDQSRTALRVYTTLTLARHIHLSTLFAPRRDFTIRLLELCEERLELRCPSCSQVQVP